MLVAPSINKPRLRRDTSPGGARPTTRQRKRMRQRARSQAHIAASIAMAAVLSLLHHLPHMPAPHALRQRLLAIPKRERDGRS
jgi:hypothetical protein